MTGTPTTVRGEDTWSSGASSADEVSEVSAAADSPGDSDSNSNNVVDSEKQSSTLTSLKKAPPLADKLDDDEKAKAKMKKSFMFKCALVILSLVIVAVVVFFVVVFTAPALHGSSLKIALQGPTDAPSTSPSSAPSDVPSTGPTDVPSNMPSDVPSLMPSDAPSTMPSEAPSNTPSIAPSDFPSSAPSEEPTSWHVDPNPVPDDTPRGYFNYDRNDDDYGPDRWNRVDTGDHFLREFRPDGFGPYRGLFSSDITLNICGGPDRRQSPKNLESTMDCEAYHEIRTWCADFQLSSDTIEAEILPHKLSLSMPRRPCGNAESNSCQVDEPPMADYPRYSSFATSYSDLLKYDIKVPSEHSIEGEFFDAEIQMLHLHPGDARMSSLGIVVRATPNGHNSDFQQILNRFQIEYNNHASACQRRRARNLRSWNDTDKFVDSHNIDDSSSPFVRQMRGTGFNPYTDALFPTMFFYRYDGSITEPPCKDITWWVLEEPMTIGSEQLEQIKRLLFTHVDEDCRGTSVHNDDQSVARPTFPLGEDREIQHCPPGSFVSDTDKGRLPGRRCMG